MRRIAGEHGSVRRIAEEVCRIIGRGIDDIAYLKLNVVFVFISPAGIMLRTRKEKVLPIECPVRIVFPPLQVLNMPIFLFLEDPNLLFR